MDKKEPAQEALAGLFIQIALAGSIRMGGWYWTRTNDLFGVNEALSRLS
jgi:hypothetical protein